MSQQTQKIYAVKGMVDIMPKDSALWQFVEEKAHAVFSTYGYKEIRTPIVEPTELFRRGVGETTSIVEKEMYTFTDQGDHSLTLRPEGTASVIRAYIESGAFNDDPTARYYYMGPMFRRERPQKGRQRQFYQIGCELLDVKSSMADAEVIAMADRFFKELGIDHLRLEVNSIGCKECRPVFNKALVDFLSANGGNLCEDCTRRMAKNPMRVFDCKSESCAKILKDAPRIGQHLCGECSTHFQEVKDALNSLKINYHVNETIVRGLDYYTRTTFEFTTDKLGSQNAVAGGGRYDGLVRDLGGPDVAGIGFALGMERLNLLLNLTGVKTAEQDIVYFAVMGESAKKLAFPMIETLRKDGVRVEWDYATKSLKAQMRRADKINAHSVVIIGDSEAEKGVAQIKNMKEKTQTEVKISDLPMHFVNIGA